MAGRGESSPVPEPGPVTRVMMGVNESTIKGYPHPSISSKGAFEWTLKKIIRSNTSGFKLLFLHVQVPDEDGSLSLFLVFYLYSNPQAYVLFPDVCVCLYVLNQASNWSCKVFKFDSLWFMLIFRRWENMCFHQVLIRSLCCLISCYAQSIVIIVNYLDCEWIDYLSVMCNWTVICRIACNLQVNLFI